MSNPKKWHEVYPQGTEQGDDEVKFFKAIARSEWEWRSVGAIAKDSGLSREKVEKIIAKYHPMGIVVQSSKNESNYGYWEVVKVKKKKDRSLSQQDQEKRLKKKADSSSNNSGAAPSNAAVAP